MVVGSLLKPLAKAGSKKVAQKVGKEVVEETVDQTMRNTLDIAVGRKIINPEDLKNASNVELAEFHDEALRGINKSNETDSLNRMGSGHQLENASPKVSAPPQGTPRIETPLPAGQSTKIFTDPKGIKKTFPDNPEIQKDAETFVRKAYTYFYNSKDKSLKGFGRFVDPNGDLWYIKKQQGASEATRFSLRKVARKKAYDLTRYGNKKPDLNAIRTALKKYDAEHLFEDLLILRKKELKLKEAAIKKTGQSIGHYKSLAQKGIDVAENIADESSGLNFARKHLKDLPDIDLRKQNIPITWEDYVKLKLPLLETK